MGGRGGAGFELVAAWPVNRDGRHLELPVTCPTSSRKGEGKGITDESIINVSEA